jgi:hypothetical protein
VQPPLSIIGRTAQAPCRRGRVSSNVRPHEDKPLLIIQQDMFSRRSALEALERALLQDAKDVYLAAGADLKEYSASIEEDIRANLCEPFGIFAEVSAPGFPFAPVGTHVSGMCIAHSSSGYWLVFQPEEERFLCFWGEDQAHLSAPGVYGSPLYCWSA